jgi:uncharacterized membrane protein YhaH (DUF805 family)
VRSFVGSYIHMWQKYADINGRDTRAEFWQAVLANAVIGVVLSTLAQAGILFAAIAGLYGLAVLMPCCAMFTRRLHDVGKSGKWGFAVVFPAVAAYASAFAAVVSWLSDGLGISSPVTMTTNVLFFVCGICALLAAGFGIYVIVLLAKRGDAGPNVYGEAVNREDSGSGEKER